MAWLDSCLAGVAPELQRAAIHQAVQHLDRGGVLAMSSTLDVIFRCACAELGLQRDADADADAGTTAVYRRTDRTTVHDMLWDARAKIDRVTARELAAELSSERPPVVVDTRTHTDRERMGVIPGSIHVPRTVLEWHLDPANGYRHPAVTGFDQPLVVVCNGGYSSSLAAASLQQLGFTNVRDLIGGVRAWTQHGHPVQAPDHAHLDL